MTLLDARLDEALRDGTLSLAEGQAEELVLHTLRSCELPEIGHRVNTRRQNKDERSSGHAVGIHVDKVKHRRLNVSLT